MFAMMQKMMEQMKPMMESMNSMPNTTPDTQGQNFPFGMMAPFMKMMEMDFPMGETPFSQGEAEPAKEQSKD